MGGQRRGPATPEQRAVSMLNHGLKERFKMTIFARALAGAVLDTSRWGRIALLLKAFRLLRPMILSR
jgi:hypothetical protein